MGLSVSCVSGQHNKLRRILLPQVLQVIQRLRLEIETVLRPLVFLIDQIVSRIERKVSVKPFYVAVNSVQVELLLYPVGLRGPLLDALTIYVRPKTPIQSAGTHKQDTVVSTDATIAN